MAAGRTLKSLISRRRRADDEGEDEEGPVVMEDSQSEASALSEAEDEVEEGGSVGDAASAEPGATDTAHAKPEASGNGSKPKKAKKPRKRAGKGSKDATAESAQSQGAFQQMADTEAMMNGLKIAEQGDDQEDVLDFESSGFNGAPRGPQPAANGHAISALERQRREHEEYKKKRDSDPAFIPNRGNFFMHDTRGQPNGQPPPQRGAWQGRGRGRGGANVGGPFAPATQVAQAERAAQMPWKHDLHEAINEQPPPRANDAKPTEVQHENDSTRIFAKSGVQPNATAPRTISFSSTTLVGKVNIRVSLPGMRAPISISQVPVKQYIRLPDHRPPLRRDKPVRILLPNCGPHYTFPHSDRSFIFIPRQMRPNQHGGHRGSYQRSVGGYGYSSRRTSMYGGSMYSASVAPSRRSSLAGVSRERAFSPAGSFAAVPPGYQAMPQPRRPVVRLPHGAHHLSSHSTPLGPLSGHQTPTGVPQMHTYSLPDQPLAFANLERSVSNIHQPTPQKSISVGPIESPVLQHAPQEAQPFQNQLPSHMNEQLPFTQAPPPQPYFSPHQQYPYGQPQAQTGTPLSGIPEQAMHAPSFQPPTYGQPPFYPSYPPPPNNYYYSPPVSSGYQPMPMYMGQPPQGYMPPQQPPQMPQQPPPPPQQAPSRPSEDGQQQSQSGMVAHESNGMVFYMRASEAQQSEQYQPAEGFVPSYAIPGLPTPPQESSMPYYYPQMQQGGMQQSGMQEIGTAVYYPAQSQQ